MGSLNDRGTYLYGDITVGVEMEGVAPAAPQATPTPDDSDGPAPPPDPAPDPEPFTVNVEIRVWQSTRDAETLYISARPEDGDWGVLGTISLDMSGLNSRGTYRYGDITLQVPVPGMNVSEPEPESTEEAIPWVDPRPDNTYTLRHLATLPAPATPTAPPLPEHVLALDINGISSVWGVRVYLASVSSVRVKFEHRYNSRNYSVLCSLLHDSHTSLSCEYADDRPLNSSGTARLSFREARAYATDLELVETTFNDEVLHCEEKPDVKPRGSSTGKAWWCYDSETYAAWERARDESLTPATDPLDRYLRAEAGPPLWNQDAPYSGEGDHTTGVFKVSPYVNYTVARSASVDHDRDVELTVVCVPYEERAGRVYIETDQLVTLSVDGQFSARSSLLCEFEVASDSAWSFVVIER